MVLENRSLRKPVVDADNAILQGILRPVTIPFIIATILLGAVMGVGETVAGDYPIHYLPFNILAFSVAAALLLYIPSKIYYFVVSDSEPAAPSNDIETADSHEYKLLDAAMKVMLTAAIAFGYLTFTEREVAPFGVAALVFVAFVISHLIVLFLTSLRSR